MIYIISLVFIIIILLLTRQLHLRSVQLKSLQQEHDTLRERLNSLTSTVSESKLLTEPLLQSTNTIHLYTALLSEESLSCSKRTAGRDSSGKRTPSSYCENIFII